MKWIQSTSLFFMTFIFAVALACSNQRQAPDITDTVRHALDQAGLNDVRVSQDRDKGVVTLSGNVNAEDDKARAESIAKSAAGDQVVANEIGVRPKGDENTARKVDSDLDSGIEKNLDAALVQHRLKDNVRYDVKNGVVTLKGKVPTSTQRAAAQKMAEQVPNVKEVVNELNVSQQRATASK
jgi:hyperosmotically inducible periplasmic protein